MKRSEMIETMVMNALCWDGLSTSGVPIAEIADDILTAIEKAGMQPPAYYDSYYDDEPECDGMISEWEPE